MFLKSIMGEIKRACGGKEYEEIIDRIDEIKRDVNDVVKTDKEEKMP